MITWQCKKCKSVQEADPKERHTMSTCDCGVSYVDAEDGYTRCGGYPIFIDTENDRMCKKCYGEGCKYCDYCGEAG